MHVTLRQLKIFEAVARHLSFTKAAAELRLSQPAVSMQIRQLEEAAGLPLFEQVGKQVTLTEAGRELAGYSRNIGQQLDELGQIMEDLRGVRRGHVAVSVASTANSFATRLLAEFCREHPGTTFSLDVTNRKSLIEQLAANQRDVVIMGQPPAELELEAEAFMENPLVVIASPDHPLATRTGIPLEELRNEAFVVRERGSGTRIAMQRFFDERGVALKADMEMTSNEAIKQSVAAGLGLGIVSAHTLELELTSGSLVVLDVEGFPILRHWYIVHRRGKRMSPTARAFKDFVLRESARQADAPVDASQPAVVEPKAATTDPAD